jgi:hypothetical protein
MTFPSSHQVASAYMQPSLTLTDQAGSVIAQDIDQTSNFMTQTTHQTSDFMA